jgi:hypothetical protein
MKIPFASERRRGFLSSWILRQLRGAGGGPDAIVTGPGGRPRVPTGLPRFRIAGRVSPAVFVDRGEQV